MWKISREIIFLTWEIYDFIILDAAAAAAAKSLQSCPTLCDPIDGSPSGSTVPGILQARTLERVAISFSDAWKWKVKGKSLSHVRLLVTQWTVAHQAPPSMGFSRQERWSVVPLPSLSQHEGCIIYQLKCNKSPHTLGLQTTKFEGSHFIISQFLWVRSLGMA